MFRPSFWYVYVVLFLICLLNKNNMNNYEQSIKRLIIQRGRLQRRGGPGAASPREHPPRESAHWRQPLNIKREWRHRECIHEVATMHPLITTCTDAQGYPPLKTVPNSCTKWYVECAKWFVPQIRKKWKTQKLKNSIEIKDPSQTSLNTNPHGDKSTTARFVVPFIPSHAENSKSVCTPELKIRTQYKTS